MPRTFVTDSGAVFPAALADFKRAKAGSMDKVKWARAEPGKPITAPYPEIIPSWLRNGFREIDAEPEKEVIVSGVSEW